MCYGYLMKKYILCLCFIIAGCVSTPSFLSNVYIDAADNIAIPQNTNSAIVFHIENRINIGLKSVDGNELNSWTSTMITGAEFSGKKHSLEFDVYQFKGEFNRNILYTKVLTYDFEPGTKYKVIIKDYRNKVLQLQKAITKDSYETILEF